MSEVRKGQCRLGEFKPISDENPDCVLVTEWLNVAHQSLVRYKREDGIMIVLRRVLPTVDLEDGEVEFGSVRYLYIFRLTRKALLDYLRCCCVLASFLT